MKFAYRTHNETVQAYDSAKSRQEKIAIAINYFERDAKIVNAEMKKKLEEDMK